LFIYFDTISLGFNYKFDALKDDANKNELNEAFSTVFRSKTRMNMIFMLRGLFPPLRFLVSSPSFSVDVKL